jgi:signal transduction histidine kinase
MLDVSKIEAGQVDLEHIPVRLRDCLEGALTPLAARAAGKGLDFQLDFDGALPSWVMGDPGRLRQIVVNLVENAIKFTDRGSLRVEVSRGENSPGGGAGLAIRVIDTGVGIPLEAQTRIFLRFERADVSTTRRKGGAGLGLSIVKSLVEALGGQVSVPRKPGEGAEFRVVLPRVAAP